MNVGEPAQGTLCVIRASQVYVDLSSSQLGTSRMTGVQWRSGGLMYLCPTVRSDGSVSCPRRTMSQFSCCTVLRSDGLGVGRVRTCFLLRSFFFFSKMVDRCLTIGC